MNRAVAMRIAACGLVGLGAALLIAALLLVTYTTSRIAKIPLDVDTSLASEGNALFALDPASLSGPKFVVDENVPVVKQQQISVEAPANADVVTLQVGDTLRRTDRQQDNGLLLAIVDTVTVDRRSGEAVSDDTNPGGAVQKPRSIEGDQPAVDVALPHEGLAYRFPFDVEKKTYPLFDPIAQQAFDANYEGEETVNGLTTYRFTQKIGYDAEGNLVDPIKYPSLYDNDEDGTVTARASQWGLQGDPEEPITMTRYYAAERELNVDPVTGTIVKAEEHSAQYYARDAKRPEVVLIDYRVTSTEDTVEQQVAAASDERDRIAVWSRILPITFTAVGLIALIGGALLGVFSLRAESALIDPGLDTAGHGFFRPRGDADEPTPGAEAETEKIPTQRPPGPLGLPPEANPPPR
ncbi:DUF3068 domain-containing protein [Mycobacterium sp. MYCO198283]|uniref:DUF3068 domain-containing protein n=1 Tax=Mycobacterium sp. MYCO198283 TaxID=2883505 RepID=UPI001E526AE4|nr:DUF3068 domain-containing protein [Mycobacterium sp. MYCO198283]MCG5432035.1 DUF3068 domain-containing protein [Mycobacterium sp. MYCO198283]